MDQQLQQMIDEVRQALQDQLHVKGPTLEVQLRKAGRLLPRRIRTDARYLARATGLLQNPKLARMIDPGQAKRAHRNILAHLQTVDMAARRRDTLVGIAASIGLALLVTGILTLIVLYQRGFI